MRLLNTRTKILKEFFDDDIPRYAILSHTWGPNEPTFQDFAVPGFRDAHVKIDGCCDRALKDNYEYVWIDNICIDKSSSAELSEAINSMFAWYAGSGVCYAYLSDTSFDHKTPMDELADPDSDFCRSRWFTRGWTLQELIAPERVEFYNSSWDYIGVKTITVDTWKGRGHETFHELLEKITGIPYRVLTGRESLSSVSVAARMTWAASRRTTRKEDVAYCLLGIFGINMSMLYGEGDRAFARLQEEIIRTSDDESIFVWGYKTTTRKTSLELGHNSWASRFGLRKVGADARLLATSPADFLGCEDVNREEPSRYKDQHFTAMSTHYSLTNKGLLIDRPIVVLPAPFDTVLVPLNCSTYRRFRQILALPLHGKPYEDAQLTMDTCSRPIWVHSDLFRDGTPKTRIYIRTSNEPSNQSGRWWPSCWVVAAFLFEIETDEPGLSVDGIYPSWLLPWQPFPEGKQKSQFFLLDSTNLNGGTETKQARHVLLDLVCPNGQRYMVHVVLRHSAVAVGVSQKAPDGTAVKDILSLLEGDSFSPGLVRTSWPTTSDDGYVRLELQDSSPDELESWRLGSIVYTGSKLKITCRTPKSSR